MSKPKPLALAMSSSPQSSMEKPMYLFLRMFFISLTPLAGDVTSLTLHITIIYLCGVAIGIYMGIHDHDAELECGYVCGYV